MQKPEENRFIRTVLDQKLNEPTELVVIDAGKILFAERKGKLKMYDPKKGKTKIIAEIPVAALSRSHNLPVKDGYPAAAVTFEWARAVFPEGLAYFIEHRDGFRTTMFLLAIQDFNFAGLDGRTNKIISCQMYLPMPNHGSTTADFFNPQIHHVERMIINGRAPYPVERTLLTSGMTLAAVESLHRGGAVIETPEMDVRYRGPKESLFWRD